MCPLLTYSLASTFVVLYVHFGLSECLFCGLINSLLFELQWALLCFKDRMILLTSL